MARKSKAPEEPETYEGLLREEHGQWQTRHADDHVPRDPTYVYSVGEKVVYGALADARVEEVLDGGVRYHISYHDKGKIYGKLYDAGRKPRIVWWVDLAPLAAEERTRFSRPRIHAQYSSTDLRSLAFTCYRRGLIENPEYHRDYAWTLKDKQRLIRSILNRTDIGKFVFVEHPYPENRLEVVDGKQRIRAVLDFMEGRFRYEGKLWAQLSREDKLAFAEMHVQTCMLDSARVKRSDILWLFLAINECGVPQTEEHVANARRLYQEALKAEESGKNQETG